jgi:para-aminobenzoate synthetase / 4-amino-4-deoxychorismate lyase
VETYPTVHQLTSTVTARLREGTRLDDVLAATFPCGSVTGAPKFTAMRAIAELEDEPRGVYCGAVGVVRPDGSATFNVAIRTLLVDRRAGTATYGAGGGVTWDSRADAEYAEALAKAALLTEGLPPFDLIETLRLDDGEWSRLERHLRRLDESARYWGFAADTARNAAAALDSVRRAMPAGSWRVRLTASADGAVRVTRTPVQVLGDGAVIAGLAGGGLAGGAVRRGAAGSVGDPPAGAGTGGAAPDGAGTGGAAPDGAGTGGAAPAAAARARVSPPAEVALCSRPVSSSDRLLFHKTTARAVYDAARAAHPDAFDVLLHNEDGLITEFTTGNVVAALGGELLTPPRECGLLAGTFRGELLDAGIIREATMTPADLRRAAGMWYINSVRGWVPVVLRRGPHEGGTGAGSR